jgi:REP-associated tyrosine transposase
MLDEKPSAAEPRLTVARRFNGGEKGSGRRVPEGRLRRYNASAMNLPHTYTSLLVHCVFSTKDRRPLITEQMQPRLWAFLGGIARKNRMKALAVGGIEDHVHILLSLPATITVAKALQLLKGGSSKWMNDQLPRRSFAWQENYGAFSIGVSQVKDTVRYIKNQKQHHARCGFAEELRMFLRRHGITPVEP